jgi:hypothetical protein
MDDKIEALKGKLDQLMREAAETAADLQAAERGTRGPVHFSQIEAAAHTVGCVLSAGIQERVKGTEMFWNDPRGAEAILQVRAAALCDDDRLARHLATRPGCSRVRRPLATAA